MVSKGFFKQNSSTKKEDGNYQIEKKDKQIAYILFPISACFFWVSSMGLRF